MTKESDILEEKNGITEETVLCYPEREGRYLMLFRNKKENDPNAGKWIGIGGHIEEGETPEQACVRETREETGLILTGPERVGIIDFFQNGYGERMFLFTATCFTGVPTGCDEGTLEWVEKERVPDLDVWEGDRIFLKMLREKKRGFYVKLFYDGDKLIGNEITENCF